MSAELKTSKAEGWRPQDRERQGPRCWLWISRASVSGQDEVTASNSQGCREGGRGYTELIAIPQLKQALGNNHFIYKLRKD